MFCRLPITRWPGDVQFKSESCVSFKLGNYLPGLAFHSIFKLSINRVKNRQLGAIDWASDFCGWIKRNGSKA